MKRSYFFPATLIIIGVVLLLNQFDLLYVTRPYLFISGSALLGLILLRKSTYSESHKGVLGGSFFLLLATLFIFMQQGYIPFYDEVIIPLVIIALGLANIIYFAISRKSYSNVTFGLIFIAVGVPFLVVYYGNIAYWEIAETFSTYWPVLLITAGFGFLIDGFMRKAK